VCPTVGGELGRECVFICVCSDRVCSAVGVLGFHDSRPGIEGFVCMCVYVCACACAC